MTKQITLLFWGFIYGIFIGYILSAITGTTFNWIASGLICMVLGFIGINCLKYFIGAKHTSK